MRVVMLTPYGSGHTGGISNYVGALAGNLRAHGISCSVIVKDGERDPPVIILAGPKLVFVARSFLWLVHHPAEVLHAHAHWYTVLPAVLCKAVNKSAKVVFTFHTPSARDDSLGARFLYRLANQCDAVTAPSQQYLSNLRAHGRVTVPAFVIPPGAHLRAVRYEQARSELALACNTFAITFIGPLVWPEKAAGVELLMQAFKELLEYHPNSILIIVGGGPYLERLTVVASKLGLRDRVRLVGGVEDVSPYLDACDTYAHISFKEGTPLSIVDALSAGKPVVASRIGGIPDLISHNETGILVGNDVREILMALRELAASHELRARIGRQAKRCAESLFTWDNITERFIAIYRQVVVREPRAAE